MQRLGLFLIWLGAAVGALVALGLGANELPLFQFGLHGVRWWIALGAVKLTLLGSAGLMAVGATLRRLGKRQDDRVLAARDTKETRRIGND
jgi:hypothetical protein